MENQNSWGNDKTGDFQAELIALLDKRFIALRGIASALQQAKGGGS